MPVYAGFVVVSKKTSFAAVQKNSIHKSLINTGVDKGGAIIGSDNSITNGCLGCYPGTAPVLTVTLCRLGREV